MAIQIIDGFDVFAPKPIDSRSTVTSIINRDALQITQRYWGLPVVVTDDVTPANNGTYFLKRNHVDTDLSNNSNWVLLTEGAGGFALADGSGTTANGSSVDLGGTLAAGVTAIEFAAAAVGQFKLGGETTSLTYFDVTSTAANVAIGMFGEDGSNPFGLLLDDGNLYGKGAGALFFDERTTKVGLEYDSTTASGAGFTGNSMISKTYADATYLTSFTLTDGQGTTANGTAVDLGGTFDTDTTILSTSANFLTIASTKLSGFSNLTNASSTFGVDSDDLAGFSINTGVNLATFHVQGVSSWIDDTSETLTSWYGRHRLDTQTISLGFELIEDFGGGTVSMAFVDTENTAGLLYAADYSLNFTARSLIDKGYADATYALVGAGGGAFEADGDSLITESSAILLDQATGDEIAFSMSPTVNKATSGNYWAFNINVTETAAPGSDNRLFSLQVGGVDRMFVSSNGNLTVSSDTNATTILGRTRISSPVTDWATVGHFNFTAFNDQGLLIDPAGDVWLNAVLGESVNLSINGTAKLQITDGIILIADAMNIALSPTTGTQIGTETSQKLAFYGSTPIVQASAMTSQLTDLTQAGSFTPDYAIQTLTNVGPYGFVSANEAETVLSVILNLQTRVQELEDMLSETAGGIGIVA